MHDTLRYSEYFDYSAPFDAAAHILNNASPGGLASIPYGTVYKRPIGPRKAASGMAAPGSSGLFSRTVAWDWSMTAPSQSCSFTFQAWYRFSSLNVSEIAPCSFINTNTDSVAPYAELKTYDRKLTIAYGGNANFLNSDWEIPLHKWFQISCSMALTNFAAFPTLVGDFRLSVRLLEEDWEELINSQPTFSHTTGMSTLRCGMTGGGSVTAVGRIGGAKLWVGPYDGSGNSGLEPASDPIDDTDDLPPVEETHHWYLGAGGDDDADGLSVETRWATVGKLNSEQTNGGILHNPYLNSTAVDAARSAYRTARLARQDVLDDLRAAYSEALDDFWNDGTGDVVHADFDGMDIGTAIVTLTAAGLTLDGGDSTLDARQTLDNGNWTATGGHSGVFEIPLTGGSGVSAVAWHNDVWLAKLDLSTYSGSESALLTALESVVDVTFYVNQAGDKLYVGGIDPTTAGGVWTRSYERLDRNSPIRMMGRNLRVKNLKVVGTCRARYDANDAEVDYALQVDNGGLGYQLITDFECDKVSKHAVANISSSDACITIWRNMICGPGTPYVLAYSTLVDFRGGGTGVGESHYWNVQITGIRAIIGTADEGDETSDAYYSHTLGQLFDGIDFWNCDFLRGGVVWEGIMDNLCTFHDCTLGYIASAGTNGVDVRRCRVTEAGVGGHDSFDGDNVQVYNSVFELRSATSPFGFRFVTGPTKFFGNTIDFRNGPHPFGLVKNRDAVDLEFKGNLLLFAGGINGVFYGGGTDDTLDLNFNVYAGDTDDIKPLLSYNDGSTTADRSFQQVSQDADSLLVADAEIDSEYLPQEGSPLIGMITTTDVPELANTRAFNSVMRPSSGDLTVGALQIAADEETAGGGRRGIGLGFGFILGG